VSILVKAGTGLAAGIIAGALGLAFFPRVEPTALKPRSAVEKPQFVAAPVVAPSATAAPRAAPALAIASEAVPADKPVAKPAEVAAKTAEVAVAPKPAALAPKPAAAPKPAEAVAAVKAAAVAPKPAPDPVQTPLAFASLDNAKAAPLGETRSISPAALQPPAPAKPAPSLAETRATLAPQAALTPPPPAAAPATATDASARWSVRGLVALAKGDLSSARLYLTRAAEAGDPRAWVALADTYDPAMLTRLGVVVAPGDTQRAKDYLVKAAAAGVLAAKDRMAALDTAAPAH
jgi:outer membrane biosynthesis protein TonB